MPGTGLGLYISFAFLPTGFKTQAQEPKTCQIPKPAFYTSNCVVSYAEGELSRDNITFPLFERKVQGFHIANRMVKLR
jgi:hypothetical protein